MRKQLSKEKQFLCQCHATFGSAQQQGAGARPLGVAYLEDGHRVGQLRRLVAQAFCSGGAFFDQRCILLGHLVQLPHRLIDFSNACALLAGSGRDFTNHIHHAAHALHNLLHGGAGVGDQLGA